LREHFRLDVNNALLFCQAYLLVQRKVEYQVYPHRVSHAGHNLAERIKWNRSKHNSPHLAPFSYCLPSDDVDSHYYWKWTFHELKERVIAPMIISSHQAHPRLAADYLCAFVASAVFFNNHKELLLWVSEAKNAYLTSTGRRHHREKLLFDLHRSLEFPDHWTLAVDQSFREQAEQAQSQADAEASAPNLSKGIRKQPAPNALPSPPKSVTMLPSPVHPHAKLKLLTSAGTALKDIQTFTTDTMTDCLCDFRHCNLSSDEAFCRYLRERDLFMPDILQGGLAVLRFAPNF
jgi:hypothetical protein